MCLLILEVWIPLFIAAARFPPQIDTISWQMGLQSADSKLRSGYVEGYGTSAVMNCLRGCDHLLHLPLKFIFKLTCEKAQREFLSRCGGELWATVAIRGRRGRFPAHSTLSLPFQIYRAGRFYCYTLFLQFLIKRKYRCLPDLLIDGPKRNLRSVYCLQRMPSTTSHPSPCWLFVHALVT